MNFTGRFNIALYVIAIVLAKVGVDDAKASGAMRLDEERQAGGPVATTTTEFDLVT